jgi:Family of unknown function (DUF6328)
MIAPAAQHRVLFRKEDKRHIVFSANRVVIAGIVFLALAMCGSILLVATKLFGPLTGAITALLVGSAFITLWLVLPLRRRARLSGGRPPSSPTPAGRSAARSELRAERR